ncbi:MAG: DUF4810 domain-containing protein [Granulosicoccus sp.]
MMTSNGVVQRLVQAGSVLVTLFMLVGCVVPDPPLYRWGEYEDIIYTGYKDPGSSDPVTDANLLAEDMARTEAEGRQVPPGLRIHLGYLYFAQGRDNEARALFEQEREVFPESRVFVDGLLSRMESR